MPFSCSHSLITVPWPSTPLPNPLQRELDVLIDACRYTGEAMTLLPNHPAVLKIVVAAYIRSSKSID